MRRFIISILCLALMVASMGSLACSSPVASPAVKCQPAEVTIGGEVTVSGSGFAPNESVILIADTVLFAPPGAAAAVMVQAMANARGEFSEVVPIPLPPGPGIPPKYSPGSTYTVRAIGSKLVGVSSFTVKAGPPPAQKPK